MKKAGLLGDDGKPKGLDGVANWDAALAKLTTKDVAALSVPADNASGWRVFYTLLNQQGGEFLKDGKFFDGDNLAKATTALAEMQKWVKNGWTPAKTEYPASIALFTVGQGRDAHQRRLGSSDDGRPRQEGALFDWGAIQIPVIYDHPATWADSHSFAIPDRKGNPVDAAKRKVVLDAVHWFNEHSLEWAGGGHVPAFCRCRKAPRSRPSSRTRTIRRWRRPRSSIRFRRSPALLRRSTTRPATTSCPQ